MQELITIQSKLQAPKAQYNKFGKFSYRNCEDILEAVKPLLKAHNCLLTLSDEVIAVGTRFYVEATVTLTNSEGKAISTKASAREEEDKKGMDGSQITGSASSYARKYALNGLFCIDDAKDPDNSKHEEKPLSEVLSDRRKALLSLTAKNNNLLNNILSRYNIGDMDDLSEYQVNETYEAMDQKGLIP